MRNVADKGNLERAEDFACKGINPKACKTCALANGKPPFADGWQKRYCAFFTRESGMRKPNAVYYDGADCPEWRKTV